jgi:hypothetical protein
MKRGESEILSHRTIWERDDKRNQIGFQVSLIRDKYGRRFHVCEFWNRDRYVVIHSHKGIRSGYNRGLTYLLSR